jgi:hypothetical protein
MWLAAESAELICWICSVCNIVAVGLAVAVDTTIGDRVPSM